MCYFFIAYMFVGFGSRNAQDSRWWGTTSGCLIFSCEGHMRQVGQPSLNFQVRFVATNLVLRWSKAWLESWTNPCYHHGLCRFGVYLVQRLARPPPQWVKPSIIFFTANMGWSSLFMNWPEMKLNCRDLLVQHCVEVVTIDTVILICYEGLWVAVLLVS